MRVFKKPLHPFDFVWIFFSVRRVAVGQVDRRHPQRAAVGRNRRLDEAGMVVGVVAGQPRRHLVELELRQDRDAVEGLLAVDRDVVAQRLDRLAREGVIDASWFPAGRRCRADRSLQPGGQVLDSLLDRIDVPGGDPHAVFFGRFGGFPGWPRLTTMPEFAKRLKDLEQIAVTGVRADRCTGRATPGAAMLKTSVKSAGGQRLDRAAATTEGVRHPVMGCRGRKHGMNETDAGSGRGWRCSPLRASGRFYGHAFVGASRAAAQGPAASAASRSRSRRRVKKPVPVRLEALGTVTPMASVAIKPRVDSEIVGVHFADGARVKQGDLLFTLDSRAIEARDHAGRGDDRRRRGAARAGASATSRRYTELVQKNATTGHQLDNAQDPGRTCHARRAEGQQGDAAEPEGAARATPRSARRSPAASAWPPSRSAISCGRPISRRSPPSSRSRRSTSPSRCRSAACRTCARRLPPRPRRVEAVIPGERKRAIGQVTMIENTVDAATGMVTVRATMPNEDELLWPGTLVQHRSEAAQRRSRDGSVGGRAGQPDRPVRLRRQGRRGASCIRSRSRARSAASTVHRERRWRTARRSSIDGQLQLTNGTQRRDPRARRRAAREQSPDMSISEACIRRPVMTTLITASLIVFGVFAYRLLSVVGAAARSTSRPSRSPRRCRARAPRPWRPRSPRRSSGSSRPSPASASLTSTSALGQTTHHRPVRPQPQHRRRGARRADRADGRGSGACRSR